MEAVRAGARTATEASSPTKVVRVSRTADASGGLGMDAWGGGWLTSLAFFPLASPTDIHLHEEGPNAGDREPNQDQDQRVGQEDRKGEGEAAKVRIKEL